MIGIYKITAPDGKVYIGQTKNHNYRFFNYRTPNRTNRSHPRLHPSFDKWGVDNHTFEMIEECSLELLNTRERHWQDFYDVLGDNGLNVLLQHTPEKKGVMREEQRLAMSERLKGKPMSESHKANVLAANAKNKGVKRPAWVGEKISKSKTGLKYKPMCEQGRENLSEALKGKSKPPRTEEHLNNLKKASALRYAKGSRNGHERMVLNTVTGIFYDTCKSAAEAHGLTTPRLCVLLNGKVKNKTNLIFA